MAVNIAELVIKHIEEERYLDALQCVQDAILEIEVKPEIAGSDRRKIKTLTSIMDKISEAAMFGSDWDEGRRAKKAAIAKLQKVSAA
ncbi:MAG: hypothetical protein HGB15_00650 [Chlorobaculum sp.]|jgi:hypothetical protein|nr:hypothetical protein [Chlorobaculum sp.]